MSTSDSLTASLEDYLETIYHIIDEKKAARVKDIATRLGVQKSSVTGALKNLTKKGHINYAPYDLITLTDKGEKTALDVIRRHEVMKTFIVDILCLNDNEAAEKAACQMEHSVPPEILERIIRFVEFTRICPRSGTEWLSGFKRFCQSNFNGNPCRDDNKQCSGVFNPPPKPCTMLSQTTLPLTEIKERNRARLVQVVEETDIHHQLLGMGVTPGSLFEVETIHARTGDMDVAVRGYHLTFRKQEAETIMVTPC